LIDERWIIMKKVIVTIAREYGSGGRKIGSLLAQKLGIDFYDKEIISLSAKKSGFSEEFIRANDERHRVSFLYDLYFHTYSPNVFDQAASAVSCVIKDIADKGSCVIVGRAADGILRKYENCVNVCIHAPIEYRAERVTSEYGVEASNVTKYIEKVDRERAAFYNFNSDGKWGDSRNYHLCVNSSVGIEETAQAIAEYVRQYMKED